MPEPTYTLDRHQAITTLEALTTAVRRYDILIKDPANAEVIEPVKVIRKQFVDLHNNIAANFGYPPIQ